MARWLLSRRSFGSVALTTTLLVAVGVAGRGNLRETVRPRAKEKAATAVNSVRLELAIRHTISARSAHVRGRIVSGAGIAMTLDGVASLVEARSKMTVEASGISLEVRALPDGSWMRRDGAPWTRIAGEGAKSAPSTGAPPGSPSVAEPLLGGVGVGVWAGVWADVFSRLESNSARGRRPNSSARSSLESSRSVLRVALGAMRGTASLDRDGRIQRLRVAGDAGSLDLAFDQFGTDVIVDPPE